MTVQPSLLDQLDPARCPDCGHRYVRLVGPDVVNELLDLPDARCWGNVGQPCPGATS